MEVTPPALTEREADAKQKGIPTFREHMEDVDIVQTDEAYALLEGDSSDFPTWFSPALSAILGPVPHADVSIVAARPGCGKTTFMLNQAKHMVEQGHRVIYLGTEMSGARLRVQLAAQACGLPVEMVVQKRWKELPPGSKERVLKWLSAFKETTGGRWFFAGQDSVSHLDIEAYIADARDTQASVFVDHLHEVDWGGMGSDLTGAMTFGIRRLKDVAKAHNVRLFLAAQLRRTGTYDVLADYMVPDQSGIKQSGATEEVAHTILLLHRALRQDATEGDLALVRRGQKRLSEVIEEGTAVLSVGKSRLVGSARGKEARLYMGNGEMYDSPEARRLSYVEWNPVT
jgi:replicative DNA helicase